MGIEVLFQQNGDSADINESQKRGIELIIASKDPTKPLEILEETLYQMTLFVNVPIDGPWVGRRMEQFNRVNRIMVLAWREQESKGIAQAIH